MLYCEIREEGKTNIIDRGIPTFIFTKGSGIHSQLHKIDRKWKRKSKTPLKHLTVQTEFDNIKNYGDDCERNINMIDKQTFQDFSKLEKWMSNLAACQLWKNCGECSQIKTCRGGKKLKFVSTCSLCGAKWNDQLTFKHDVKAYVEKFKCISVTLKIIKP